MLHKCSEEIMIKLKHRNNCPRYQFVRIDKPISIIHQEYGIVECVYNGVVLNQELTFRDYAMKSGAVINVVFEKERNPNPQRLRELGLPEQDQYGPLVEYNGRKITQKQYQFEKLVEQLVELRRQNYNNYFEIQQRSN